MLYYRQALNGSFYKRKEDYTMDNEILQILQSMNKKMDVMGDKVDYLYSMKDKIESIDEINSKVDSLYSMKDKVDSIDERLSALEDVVTVMQYEHGRKLDLLLDYAKASIEKHEQYDKQFDYVYSKMFDYDVRLSVIEDSEHFQNVMAKKAAFIRKFADKGKEIVESQNKKIAQYNPNNK